MKRQQLTRIRRLLFFYAFNLLTDLTTAILPIEMQQQQKDLIKDTSDDDSTIKKIIHDTQSVFPKDSFDVHAFKVDWYNELVAPEYRLPYEDGTVALIFFTIPHVFENSFLPFLCHHRECIKDSWHKFIKFYMQKVQQKLNEVDHLSIQDEDIVYSFEMVDGNAKVAIQTAGHVAGGAFYYQRRDVVPDPWPENKTIYGVSMHPFYGGYFSLDAVLVLREIKNPKMIYKPPIDVVNSWTDRKEMLTIYNENWKNPKWRQIFPVKRKYSEERMKYELRFGKSREDYLEELIEKHCPP